MGLRSLDPYLPRHDVSETHSIEIRASAERVSEAVHELDLRSSTVIRTLFSLRGMPPSALTLRGLQTLKFTILVDAPPRDLILGLIGRFWTVSGDLQRFEPSEFTSFERPGYAKAVWGFAVEPLSQDSVRLVTETRVQCLDPASRRRFRRYWILVGPFSRWIRREALHAVKRSAEP